MAGDGPWNYPLKTEVCHGDTLTALAQPAYLVATASAFACFSSSTVVTWGDAQRGGVQPRAVEAQLRWDGGMVVRMDVLPSRKFNSEFWS